MNELNKKLSRGAAFVVGSGAAIALFTSAAQPVQQTNAYTSELTAVTGGRQISILAPAPSAPLQAGLGIASGTFAIFSLWRLLNDGDEIAATMTPASTRSMPLSTTTPGAIPMSPRSKEPMSPRSQQQTAQSELAKSKLNPVLFAGLVSLIGGQGAGKTTLAAAILRERIKAGHQVKVFNHHYEFGSYAPLKVYGKGSTLREQFSDIAEGLQWFLEERESRYAVRQSLPKNQWDFMKEPLTVLIEELGEYAGQVDKDLMQRFLQTVCIGVRKANMYVIFVSQNDTMAMFGGAKGLAKMLQDGVVNVELENQPDATRPGGLGPTGWAVLTINGGQSERVKVPNMAAMFPTGQDELDFTDLFSQQLHLGLADNDNEPTLTPEQELAERLYSLPSQSPPHEQPLAPHLQAILDYAREEKKPIKARDIISSRRLSTEILQDLSEQPLAETIRAWFVELAEMGHGETGDKGDRLWFRAY